ncbi:MAG: phospho-sugar mutase [Candidatus Auribacterota bacterium]|jgi:phosphoglucomutase|nr:phospho-sugar mutase [Candidatus Auribacterota bacterium]
MDKAIEKRIQEWLGNDYDQDTRSEIQKLIDDGNHKELTDRFYQDLDFGTGGLRGVIGAGTNRINTYTIRKATQGLATYIIKQGPSAVKKGVAVAYDSRHKSPEFALETALVLAGNGIKAYLYESLRPTPLLSFAVRYLGAQGGVNVTASHNPKEYNGYKVYWDDGGQVVPPHDKNIISEVRQITSLSQVKLLDKETALKRGLLIYIGEEVDNAYIDKVLPLSLNPQIVKQVGDSVSIVFTPLHGAGITMIPKLLDRMGFKRLHIVEQQKDPDPDFSTVVSPNPEESAAMKLALEKARELDADIVLATDPDADRLGVAVKDSKGKFVLLSGNQTGSLIIYYVLSQLKAKGKLPENGVVIKTIVTTELQREIAAGFDIECIDVLTGFKYIAEKILEFETQGVPGKPSKIFLAGGEESYGYLIGTHVRDKDAVIAAAIIAEIAAYARFKNTTVFGILEEIYREYGYYSEKLKSLVYKGKEGMDTISSIMRQLRENPPKTVAGVKVNYIGDYQKGITVEPIKKQTIGTIDLPASNVLAFCLIDGTTITIRPSGTEPKIKIYLSSMEKNDSKSLDQAREDVKKRLEMFLDEFISLIEELVNQ